MWPHSDGMQTGALLYVGVLQEQANKQASEQFSPRESKLVEVPGFQLDLDLGSHTLTRSSNRTNVASKRIGNVILKISNNIIEP